MKCLGITVGFCLLAFVYCENCPGGTLAECSHTSCDSVTELHCVDGICQCTEAGPGACPNGTVAECSSAWSCPPDRKHCIDQQCRCSRFPAFG